MFSPAVDKAIITALCFVIAFYELHWGWLVLWLGKVILPPQVRLVLWLLRLLGGREAEKRGEAEFKKTEWNRLSGILALIVGSGLFVVGIMFLSDLISPHR